MSEVSTKARLDLCLEGSYLADHLSMVRNKIYYFAIPAEFVTFSAIFGCFVLVQSLAGKVNYGRERNFDLFTPSLPLS